MKKLPIIMVLMAALVAGCARFDATSGDLAFTFDLAPGGEVSVGVKGAFEIPPAEENEEGAQGRDIDTEDRERALGARMNLSDEQKAILALIENSATSYGLDPRALAAVGWIESNFRNVKNPRSSASGIMQFITSTGRAYGLADPFDVSANVDAGARLMADNARILREGLGKEPALWMLYLAHQQGSEGALTLLRNADRAARDIIGTQEFALNTTRLGSGASAADFIGEWKEKFDRAYARFVLK